MRYLGCLLTLLLLALSGDPRARADGPRGIYLYPLPKKTVLSGDYERAMGVPGVDGVAVVLDWAELSPSARPRTYDFTELDRLVSQAQAHHLAVELVIPAGKGVPAWMFAPPPAGLGAKRLDFVYSHHSGAGPCQPVAIPPPWEAAYQEAFADMLNQVSAHLRASGALADIAVVKLTGLNTTTEELRLPAETAAQTGKACVTDAVTTWHDAGYRPALIVQAMKGLAAAFARAFPDVWVTMPVILAGGFPPIDDKGQVLPLGRARAINARLLDELVRAAAATLPGRFILQEDFLIADQPANPRAVELATRDKVPIAWQTNLYLGQPGKGAACGGRIAQPSPCDAESYLHLLQMGIHPAGGNGVSAVARFIEVFPSDALEFPASIATAHAALTR